MVLLAPESPRFSATRGKYKEAFQSLKKMRNSELIAARDLYLMWVANEEERKLGVFIISLISWLGSA
jgi:hypothetical protein